MLSFILLLPGPANAQKYRFSGLIGYDLGGKSDVSNIIDGWNYAFYFTWPVAELQKGVVLKGDFSYSRQNTELEFDEDTGVNPERVDFRVEYFQAGVLMEKPYRKNHSVRTVECWLYQIQAERRR